MKILHLDIDGGYGGSSRSLYLLLESLLQTDIESEVWFKKAGPSYEKSKKLNIKSRVNKKIASIIPLKKNNIKNFIVSFWQLKNLWFLASDIINAKIDVLHLNYEGLLPLCIFLKIKNFDKKIIVHVRHMLPNNLYGKIFVRLFKFVDGIIFITEMEKQNVLNINNAILDKIPNQVYYNCSSDKLIKSTPKINKKYYKAIFLGSIDRSRAPDRIIKIAYHAKKENLPIIFFIFGKESRKSILKNKKSITVKFLKKAIISNNLDDIVFFKGFSKNPESILLDSDILISPDRMNEPWGRDILESLSAGLIVIASGDDEIFIKNNINGFLIKNWDERKVVQILKKLVNEVDIMKKIRKEAKKTGKNLFSMSDYSNKIYSFFTKFDKINYK